MITSCEMCECAVVVPDEPDRQPPAVLCNCCRNRADSAEIFTLNLVALFIVIIVVVAEKLIGLIAHELIKLF